MGNNAVISCVPWPRPFTPFVHTFPPQVPATVEFVDIAGLVKGASKGEGMGNQFLTNIRNTDAICQVWGWVVNGSGV